MICEDKKTNDNSPATICCRWFCPPLHLIPVWLNSPFPIITKKLSKIFSNTERRKMCSVRNGSSVSNVSTGVNEREGRGYRCRCTSVPFSLYFIYILWLHSKDDRKGDGFFRFQTIIGAQVRFLQRFSSLSFLLSVYDLAFFLPIVTTPFLNFLSTLSIRSRIPSLLHCPTGHECRRFRCQNRIKYIFFTNTKYVRKNIFYIHLPIRQNIFFPLFDDEKLYISHIYFFPCGKFQNYWLFWIRENYHGNKSWKRG